LANSVSAALSGEGSEAFADSEIQNMIQSHVQNMVAEQVMSGETQKTNLEEQNLVEVEQTTGKHHHKKHHKKHHHGKKPVAQAQVQTALAAKTPVPIAVKVAPASKSLLATKGKSGDAL